MPLKIHSGSKENWKPSIFLWASPIVVIPKLTQPEKAPRRWLFVDYRALNNLLPHVTKAHSKAKTLLTLGPLPKTDESVFNYPAQRFIPC